MIEIPVRIESESNRLYRELRRAYVYDPETGILERVKRTGPNCGLGPVGSPRNGYLRFHLAGTKHAVHRMVWLYVYGSLPDGLIDHINGDPSDNRLSNLRDVDHSTNLENLRRARSDNQLNVLGVRCRRAAYEARIMVKGSPVHLGSFPTQAEAAAAYVKAKRRLHAGCSL